MSGEAERPTLRYVPELDGLRAVAVISVMICHSPLTLGRGGFLGVDLFFVLSGYLIATLLLQEHAATGRIALGAFYMRRARRLLPALVGLCFGCVAIWIVLPTFLAAKDAVRALPAVLFYFANWLRSFGVESTGLFGHAWSLSIEEQFYMLVAPITLLATRGGRSLGGPRVLFALAGAIAIARGVAWILGVSAVRLYQGTDFHSDGLLLGCGLAALSRQPTRLRPWMASKPLAWAAAAVFALLVAFVPDVAFGTGPMTGIVYCFALPVATLCAAALVLHAHHGEESTLRAVLRWAPLRNLGRISYGVYLWHFPLYLIAGSAADRYIPGYLANTLYHPIAIVVAYASYVIVERPFLRRGRESQTVLAAPGAARAA